MSDGPYVPPEPGVACDEVLVEQLVGVGGDWLAERQADRGLEIGVRLQYP
jgi:hypothetical protein